MIRANPPRWLENALLLLLPARDRETVSGDLLELYREDKLPRTGRLRADLWYGRQIVSLAPRRLQSLPAQPRLLVVMCLFTALAGTWLGVMDLVLRHPLSHEVISITIITESVLTLAVLALRQPHQLRLIALGGSAGILYLGLGALVSLFTGAEFEGYILLIALALIAQAVLTVLTLRRPRPEPHLGNQPL